MSQNKFEFHRQIHDYVNEYIRYADTKASILITWNLAIIGAIFTNDDLKKLLLSWIALLALLAILASTGIAFWVIKPRLREKHQCGLTYWQNIVCHGSPAEYLKAISSSDDDALNTAICTHNYFLSVVASKKYKQFAMSLIISAISTATLVAMFLISHFATKEMTVCVPIENPAAAAPTNTQP